RGERAFNADQVFFEGIDSVVGKPIVEFLLGGFAGENLEPGDLACAAVGFLDRRVKNALAGGPNIRAGAVTTNERKDRVVGNVQFAGGDGDFRAGGGSCVFVGHWQFDVRF